MNLRPYQTAALQGDSQWPGIFRALVEKRSALLVLPTGTGKTEVAFAAAAEIIRDGGIAIMLADRRSLVKQTYARAAASGMPAAVEMGEARAQIERGFISACVPSLQGDRLTAYQSRDVRLVIVDEADLAAAKTYRAILDALPHAKVLGVTATPMRGDGKSLGAVFETIAYRYALLQAIRDGWLVDLRRETVRVNSLDLSNVPSRAGDLAKEALCAAMLRCATEQARRIVQATADRRATMVFSVAGRAPEDLSPELRALGIVAGQSNAHGTALSRAMNSFEGVRAAFVHGEIDDADIERAKERLASGELTHLVNCGLFVRGTDIPPIDCVVPRPTESWSAYVQMVGRGTRLSPATGKRDCLILNLAGQAGRHPLVEPADLAGEGDQKDLKIETGKVMRERQDLGVAAAAVLAEERLQRRQALPPRDFVTVRDDPFVGQQLRRKPWGPPASPGQLAFLTALGVQIPSQGIDRGTAGRLISHLKPLRDAGPPSDRMVACLRAYRVDPTGLTWAQAHARIDELKKGSR